MWQLHGELFADTLLDVAKRGGGRFGNEKHHIDGMIFWMMLPQSLQALDDGAFVIREKNIGICFES